MRSFYDLYGHLLRVSHITFEELFTAEVQPVRVLVPVVQQMLVVLISALLQEQPSFLKANLS